MCLSHSTISRNIYHNIYNVDIDNYVVLGFSPYDGRIQSRIVSVKWTCQRLRKSSRPWLLQLQDRLPGESFTEPGDECAAKETNMDTLLRQVLLNLNEMGSKISGLKKMSFEIQLLKAFTKNGNSMFYLI